MKISPKKRHNARRFLVQALYQWQMTGDDVGEILLSFMKTMNIKKTDAEYFQTLLRAIPKQATALDALYTPYLDRSLEAIGPVELSILRIASYELQYGIEIPYRVIINEAIELAKTFGPEESFKYINSILDKVAEKSRSIEINISQ